MKAKVIISAASMLLLIAAGVLLAVKNNITPKNNRTTETSEPGEVSVTEAITEEPYIPPVFVECSSEDIHRGSLILVNREYAYKEGSNSDLANIYSMKSDSYKVNTVDMRLDKNMILAMNSMLDDFKAATGITDVLANSGYRSYSEQQIMYENDLETTGLSESELVAPPGNSEHHTGYAMDFAIDDGYSYPALKNEEDYTWIYDNAHKYGMILRYTEQNKHITGYMAESWHFRYVGPVHATLIRQMGVAYEEYVGFLKDFTFDRPLEYKYSDDDFYMIYYVPADMESGKTEIPITFDAYGDKDRYSISGNNSDGFIVTLRIDELSDDYDDSYLYMFNPIQENVPVDDFSYEEPVQENAAADENVQEDAVPDENGQGESAEVPNQEETQPGDAENAEEGW